LTTDIGSGVPSDGQHVYQKWRISLTKFFCKNIVKNFIFSENKYQKESVTPRNDTCGQKMDGVGKVTLQTKWPGS
jgi:hypothetical protein